MDIKEAKQKLDSIGKSKIEEGSIRRQIRELEELHNELDGSPTTTISKAGSGVSDPTEKAGVKRASYTEKIALLKDKLADMVMRRMATEEQLMSLNLCEKAKEYARLRYIEGRNTEGIKMELDRSDTMCGHYNKQILEQMVVNSDKPQDIVVKCG